MWREGEVRGSRINVPGLVEALRCGFAERAGVEEASSESGAGSCTRWRLSARVEVALEVVEASFSQGRVRAICAARQEEWWRQIHVHARWELDPALPKAED